MERRLGRGLGSLLGAAPTETELKDRTDLPLDQISPNPFQPRKHFDPAALEELRDSIRRHGVLQPIVVRRTGQTFQLVSGERRWRCARLAGLTGIPAVVREVADNAMLELALIENLQRRDLGALEKARGYRDMMESLKLTQEQVAERMALGRASVANHLRLLELPTRAQEALEKGLISMGHARALLGLKDERSILKVVEQVVRDGLSVREVEESVRKATRAPSPASPEASEETPKLAPAPPWVKDLEDRMREALGTKVTLRNGSGYRGSIVIDYFQRDDLERIVEQLAPSNRI